LTLLNVPNIRACSFISIVGAGFTSLNIPAETSLGGISISSNLNLVSVSFPRLKTAGQILFNAINSVTTPFSAPLLESIFTTGIQTFPVDIPIELPSLKFIRSATTTFSFGYVPPLLETVEGNVVIWTASGTVSSLTLPNLKTVTGTLTISRDILDFIELPLLQVGGVSCGVFGTFYMRSLNLPSLGNYIYNNILLYIYNIY
jgi:hypothetical protein